MVAGNFEPRLAQAAIALNMKDPNTPSYMMEDVRTARLQVEGTGIRQVSFASGDPSVATVTDDGTVTAVAGGSAQITVTVESASGEQRELTAWAYVRDETRAQTSREAYDPADCPFDFGDEIDRAALPYKSRAFTTPVPFAMCGIRVRDDEGADGVQLAHALDRADDKNLYLNAFVAGHTLHVSVPGGAVVRNVLANGTPGSLTRRSDTEYLVRMQSFSAEDTASAPEQTIEVRIAHKTYVIHTRPESMPRITTYRSSSNRPERGVYTLASDHYLMRVSTDRRVVYYRNLRCVCDHAGTELQVKNFRAQDAADDGQRYYTYFVELDPTKRTVLGGFFSGMYVIMDRDYREISYATLLPNGDKGHGEGYLDQHEFNLLGPSHWLSLSYTAKRVANIPGSVPTLEGSGVGYVVAGIIQEVRDERVLLEFDTTDHPVLYETSMEACDYVDSSDEGAEVTNIAGVTAFSPTDGFIDYVHVNSVAVDPTDGNLVVSMRHQYAVFKIDRSTGEIIWKLGGLGDDFGLSKQEKFIGQHYAYFEDPAIAGKATPTLLLLDNHTNFEENETRVAEIEFDAREGKVLGERYYPTAPLDGLARDIGVGEVPDPVTGRDTMPMHWATHCGSVARQSSGSLVIGWGLNALYSSVADLPLVPILTEYDPTTNAIEFELYMTRNEHYSSSEARFSYRVYKNAF